MITYPDSVRFLYSLGNEIKTGKFGLETIARVLEELGSPQNAFRVVHVAGTNGKGSTCAMIASALQAAGIRTGLYTSPHLVEPTERIQIDGKPVTAEEFSSAFDTVHQASERLMNSGQIENHPTYFETVTAMAFVLFREHGVERAVVEVGLGGRLDATNVVSPDLCVITPVDYDHESYLGSSIESIAAEKAGILKPGVPIVSAPQRPEAERVIRMRVEALGCAITRVAGVTYHCRSSLRETVVRFEGADLRCPLIGRHQGENIVTAVLALRQIGVPPDAIARGVATVIWPGRMECVASEPDVILDGAHNPAGVRALANHIRAHYRDSHIWLIYGTMRDKSVGEIADTLFPLAQELILTAPDSPRSLDPQSLLAICGHPRAMVAANLSEALDLARAGAAIDDIIFISGSLFLVGEARAMLVK
jgi:dihydrofolate synthase/folylpolyglutamate synthase